MFFIISLARSPSAPAQSFLWRNVPAQAWSICALTAAPAADACCPMAQMLTVDELRRWKSKYPKLPVVLYVNTLAEVKAECDVCCTSANVTKVIDSIDSDALLFGPDRNLALYAAKHTNKRIISVPERGYCPTHVLFQKADIDFWKAKYPDAPVIVHPECTPEVQSAADYVGSTSQMCQYAQRLNAKVFPVSINDDRRQPICFRMNESAYMAVFHNTPAQLCSLQNSLLKKSLIV
jgi:quinolinate synthetase A subunit